MASYRQFFGSPAFSRVVENLFGGKSSEKLQAMRIVGEAGAGMVRATMLGTGKLEKIEIDPVIKGKGSAAMEELIILACNNAYERVQNEIEKETLMEMHRVASDPKIIEVRSSYFVIFTENYSGIKRIER